MKTLCIYHNNCADGFAAAWVVREALGSDQVDFYAADYQQAPPDVAGRDLIIVDFSYPIDVMTDLAAQAKCITVLDHHESAEKNLIPLLEHGVIKGRFAQDESGCGMAWQHFFKGRPMPKVLHHIQDRDLWKFELEGTREITAGLFAYPYDFKEWDQLMQRAHTLYSEGTAILRKHQRDVSILAQTLAYFDTIAGHKVPVINAPMFFASDVCHLLAEGHPFAACYQDTEHTRKYSLRSRPDGINVSEIAALFGGGGHRHAAGFSIDKNDVHTLAEKGVSAC